VVVADTVAVADADVACVEAVQHRMLDCPTYLTFGPSPPWSFENWHHHHRVEAAVGFGFAVE